MTKTTLISLLKKDAYNTIKNWNPKYQNEYYDKKIDESINNEISVLSYTPSSNALRQLASQGILTFTAMLFAQKITPESTKSFMEVALKMVGIPLFVFGASFFVVPKLISPYEKKKILKNLKNYILQLELSMNDQSDLIIKRFI